MSLSRAGAAPRLHCPTRRAVLVGAAVLPVAGGGGAAAAGLPVRIADPPPGKAVIVFYRRAEYFDALISYIVREDKAELGRLSNGSYFVAVVDPGLHTYTTRAERHTDMQIVAEAGEIYYVRFELDVGFVLYQPTLTPSEQRLFDAISSRLTLSAPLASSAAAAGSAPAPP